MPITVNTAADDQRLTTLSRVKLELGISNNDSDQLLNGYIKQASDLITRYTGRVFAEETVTETLPSNGDPILVLERTPISSVTQIKYDGSTVSSTEYLIQDPEAGILFKENGWTSTILYVSHITRWPTRFGKYDWSVQYVAGYKLPNSSAPDLPEDVERACLDTVKAWYHDREENPNVVSQKTGDASETRFKSADGSAGVPPVTLKMLERWRRVDI